ncbi:adenosylcobinamide-GDP ribazoletransferase [Nakamurella sp. YIM 132084]|uniref:Adenosylcobinamide-GDP ribazoletransferase n=1 Tax=Nakamurella leprariae TaxID=2803911 RepID=A0A938Y974_9ACTN|nr:adenosylcobinamide-GDP ribazoletransferase [Nakamurella leprariae]
MLTDGLRLAVGTLTVLRVPAPRRIDRARAGVAMGLAPLAVLPLGAWVGALAWLGSLLAVPALVTAGLAVATVAVATRGLHLDGLADTADGLAASFDREQALAVMRTGDIGPAGVVTATLTVLLQVAALAAVLARPSGWLLAGLLVVLARIALAAGCRRGVPAARPEGLGATVAGSVPGWVGPVWLLLAGGAAAAAMTATGRPWWQGVAAVVVAAAAVLLLLRRCVRRLGGTTGDVMGAMVETAVTALLVVGAAG